MALQQTVLIDKIEITENGILQIRQRTDIFDDTNPLNIIASNYTRWVLEPGQDLTGQEPKVIAIANATWTLEVINSYQEQQKLNKPSGI